MDWIEEKIEQFRNYIQDTSLIKSLVWYLCIGMVGVWALYWITRNICLAWLEVIAMRNEGITYTDTINPLGKWAWYTEGQKEKLLMCIANFFYSYGLYIYTVINFFIVGKMFLKKKIKPALEAVTKALNYINIGDYSHEITWHSQDEMGALCEEIEQMRKKMLKDKKNQWKMQEEQRKINAAFAHDIRTPLTVIKGYTEFLQRYVPKGRVTEALLLEKLDTMHEQEERLLKFSTTMTTIQNFEKWELSCAWYQVSELVGELEAVIKGVQQNADKEITLQEEIPEQELFLDKNLLIEVFENMLSNALRYAVYSIQVKIILEGREFTVFVKDDGPGFSQKALRSGAETYFSEEENSKEHFGIGLSICKLLCENHGGRLSMQNSMEQGAITTATLIAGVRNGGKPESVVLYEEE